MKKLALGVALLSLVAGCGPSDGIEEIPLQAGRPFKVATVEFNPKLNERDENLTILVRSVEEAAKNGAKLIVTPEMSTTGYSYASRSTIAAFVDSIPGKATELLEDIARVYDAYIVVGMAEVDPETNLYYNAAALVGPGGYIGKYRKSHQWETDEHWATWGDLGVPVFNTKLGKIAINICMDSAYFEPARLAALAGADILAFPANSSGQAVQALQARAEQNGFFVVSSNRTNTEGAFHMIGTAGIWSPMGEKLAEAPFIKTSAEDVNDPTIVYAEIDPEQYANPNRRRMAERRPDAYKDLMLTIAPWDYTKNTTSKRVKAQAIQYAPVPGDKNANFAKIRELAGAADVDLIVLPELSLTGLVADRTTAERLAEPLSGSPSIAKLSSLATARGAHVVGGLIEKAGEHLFNTAVLVSRNGDVIGTYRKVHLTSAERAWASAGSDFPVYNSELGRVGMLIGYDAAFPEAGGVLMVRRADIIAIPSSWDGSYGTELKFNYDVAANRYPRGSMSLWDSLAMSAQAYTVVANYVGGNFRGRSGVYTLDPMYGLDQPVVGSDSEPQVVTSEFSTLHLEWWLNQEMIVVSRRTHMYLPLVRDGSSL